MSKRKLILAASVLVLLGGAAAIAAVGNREDRMGHRGMMDEMGGSGGHGWRGGHGEGRWHRGGEERHMRGDRDDMMGRQGSFRRGVTAEDFDARVRERFARFDKNSDGVIDTAEVEATLSSEAEGRRGRFREWMGRRGGGDRGDADVKRTRQEFLDRVRKSFARMDLDSDGRITDADLPPMMRGRDALKRFGSAERGMGGGRGMMGGMGGLAGSDANQDGVITLDEVLAAAGKRFDLMDRNKDGSLDRADRDAMTKEMTDYRVRRFLHAHGGKDGRVTREQFTAAAKERFAERDANNDGRIDRGDRGGRGMGPGMGKGGPMRDGMPPAGGPSSK